MRVSQELVHGFLLSGNLERRSTFMRKIGEYEHLVVASFSGVICVDELYDDKYAVLCARDPLNGQTIAYELCERVNQEEVTKFFRRLKAMGIKAEVAVTDDSALYPKAIKAVWQACKHQLCKFHWTKNIVTEVNRGVRKYREGLPKPAKRAKPGRPKKSEGPIQAVARKEESLGRQQTTTRSGRPDLSGCLCYVMRGRPRSSISVAEGVWFLQQLPFIGPVTAFHLAKNLGIEAVKPDRHLCRLSKLLGRTGYVAPSRLSCSKGWMS